MHKVPSFCPNTQNGHALTALTGCSNEGSSKSKCGLRMAESNDCGHIKCTCHIATAAAGQNLEEVAFVKSACAAAQSGNCAKLKSMLAKNQDILYSDGAEGERDQQLV